jgi:hypothetical protein
MMAESFSLFGDHINIFFPKENHLALQKMPCRLEVRHKNAIITVCGPGGRNQNGAPKNVGKNITIQEQDVSLNLELS